MFKANEMSSALERVGSSFTSHNSLVHEFACSAVMLAATTGEPAWLTALHDRMPKLYQDALKAWVGPKSGVWGENAWLRFDTQLKSFAIIKNTVSFRPTADQIEAVSKDMNKYLMNKSARSTVDQLNWEDELEKRLKNVHKYAKKENGVTTELVQLIDEFYVRSSRLIHLAKWAEEDKRSGVAPPDTRSVNIDTSAVVNASTVIQ